jgi:hypothetical protein
VSAVAALLALTFAALAARGTDTARGDEPARTLPAAPDAASYVGVWDALLPNGVRAGSLAVVPAAGGVAGAFVGYDYERPTDSSTPTAGGTPKIATRTGSTLIAPKLDGGVLAFSMQLRMTNPPPGAPEFFDIRGEMRLTGDGTGELKLSSPRKPEPLTLTLTRD